ncbi:MAG TPA: hypothetical protein VEQ58_09760 [Polyangiaceae bacterium]|nr:hypothetical protein [Polyangiaceae bacterium]
MSTASQLPRKLGAAAASNAAQPVVSSRAKELGALGLVLLQVMLAVVVMGRLGLQSSAVRRVLLFAGAGFVVHHFLPARHKLRFFLALSVLAMFVILGGTPHLAYPDPKIAVPRVAALLGFGCAFIAISLARVRLALRIGALLVLTAVLAVLRSGWFDTGVLNAIWPLIAVFFMFRLIGFLYDITTSGVRPSFAQSAQYFFALPAVVATFLPVIDFKKFSTPSKEAALLTYQRGASWIGRGALQLVAHRVVSQVYYLPQSDVRDGVDLVQFLLSNVFLYLKLSGVFHLLIGILLLFGFNLPETNSRYTLASSFTDYWRRVNIYWKDFILKVFYFPAFFKLKKRGQTFALVLSTLWAFFATWALHLYQTWWLRGTASVSWPDTLFWTILGLLVLVNSLSEMAATKRPAPGRKGFGPRDALTLMLKTAGTFAAITALWSLWNTSSIAAWAALWKLVDLRALGWAALALALVMLAKLLLEIWPEIRAAENKSAGPKQVPLASPLSLFNLGALGAVFLLCLPRVQQLVDHPALQPFWDASHMNDASIEGGRVAGIQNNPGYYESLATVDNPSRDLWQTFMREPLGTPYVGADPSRPVKDFRYKELLPSLKMQVYDTEIATNSFGMRGPEYTLAKPARTLRIALLGSSNVMGWGVPFEETFGAALERDLDAASAKAGWSVAFQVQNFAFNRYSSLGQLDVVRLRVARFSPDIVLFIAHDNDFSWLVGDIQRSIRERMTLPDHVALDVLHGARVAGRTHYEFSNERLEPHRSELMAWSYGHLSRAIRSAGALPVAIFLPTAPDIGKDSVATVEAQYAALLTETGFVTLRAPGVFAGHDPDSLRKFDHYNPLAHRLVAEALEGLLVSDPRVDLRGRAVKAGQPANP